MRRIVIAAGGTGGHISPGIALLEEIQKSKDQFGIEAVFLHSPRRNKDNPDLQEPGCSILWHNLPQFKWKNSIIFPFVFLYELSRTFLVFRKNKINTVIGMGGYTSLLSILVAILTRKPFYLCEQNCMPGKITRTFWKRAEKLACSFPLRDPIPEGVNSKILGNPVRSSVIPKTPSLKNQTFTSRNQVNVLVLGGSQGARQINTMVVGAMQDELIQKNFKFRVLTGTNLYQEFKKSSNQVEAISYSRDMATHYEWADLVVARSGAGVLAECTIYALPMILIPYPYAMDNHQKENANYFLKEKACILIDTKESLSKPLVDSLTGLWEDQDQFIAMAMASLSLARINASHDTLVYFFHETN